SASAEPGELHLRLIERLAPLSAVVDSEHRIVHLSRKLAAFLQLKDQNTLELPRLIHPVLRPTLRAALKRAAAGRQPVGTSRIPLRLEGKPCVMRMTVSPAEELAPGYLLVLVDVLKRGAKRRVACDSAPLVRELHRELEIIRMRLDETMKQAAVG